MHLPQLYAVFVAGKTCDNHRERWTRPAILMAKALSLAARFRLACTQKKKTMVVMGLHPTLAVAADRTQRTYQYYRYPQCSGRQGMG